jgi:oligosaccharide repeat unit polymerase
MVVGAIAVKLLINRAGFNVWAIAQSPKTAIEIGRYYASLRYGFGESGFRGLSFINAFLYTCLCIGGVLIVQAKSWGMRFIAVVPLIIGLIETYLVNARSGFVWMLVFFLGSILAANHLLQADRRLFTKKRMATGIILFISLAAFYGNIQSIREGENSNNKAHDVRLKLKVAILSQPSAFSHWLRRSWDRADPQFGKQTFAGLFEELGIARRDVGLGWEGDSEIPTFPNVYTAFRQIIEDLTLPGAAVLVFLCGWLYAKIFHAVSLGAAAFMPALQALYAATLGSYIASWTVYNSCILGWVAYMIFVLLAREHRKPHSVSS